LYGVRAPGNEDDMTQQRAPRSDAIRCDTYHAILSVPDVQAAVAFYTTKLGFWRAFEEGAPARFAGVNLGQVQLFLEAGPPGPEGCALYFVVNDADELFRRHRDAGVEIMEEPANREYRLRDYTVRDMAGYRLTFGHRL
jgi:catechol 2,3-dioxygenase-like lactoylglutathione lyase family enzyme